MVVYEKIYLEAQIKNPPIKWDDSESFFFIFRFLCSTQCLLLSIGYNASNSTQSWLIKQMRQRDSCCGLVRNKALGKIEKNRYVTISTRPFVSMNKYQKVLKTAEIYQIFHELDELDNISHWYQRLSSMIMKTCSNKKLPLVAFDPIISGLSIRCFTYWFIETCSS